MAHTNGQVIEMIHSIAKEFREECEYIKATYEGEEQTLALLTALRLTERFGRTIIRIYVPERTDLLEWFTLTIKEN